MKKAFIIFLAALYSTTMAIAQETKSVDINVNKSGGNWYSSPWVWVIVAAVFILLLVALTRGGGRRD